MSTFAERRLANIQANNEELSKINAEKRLFAPKPDPKPTKKRSTPAPRAKRELPKRETRAATRQSSRLAGIGADNEALKRKFEVEIEAKVEEARQKKQRVSGDLSLADIEVEGRKWEGGLSGMQRLGLGIPARGAEPGVRTFKEEDVKETTDKDLKSLRVRMGRLKLYEQFPVQDIKITPQRIYSMSFHPTEAKALVFAGDKEGALGIFDASQDAVKIEDDDDEDDYRLAGPIITALKIHARTISSIYFSPVNSDTVCTSSYDSSIRSLDLAKEVSQEVFAPEDPSEDMAISTVDMHSGDPFIALFSTLDGRFGRHDMRTGTHDADIWELTDQKIGGFSTHPLHPHLIATASLDRYMRIWDLRMLGQKKSSVKKAMIGEHLSRKSVSHASWSSAGHIATSSYDDLIKIYSFPDAGNWEEGHSLSDDELNPLTVRHNNQTGRWVTILKPHWQRNPQDGVQKFVIGNMNRFVDVYDASGEQLAQLGGDGITAVPAVAHFHPTRDWIAAGSASGKLCLWQ